MLNANNRLFEILTLSENETKSMSDIINDVNLLECSIDNDIKETVGFLNRDIVEFELSISPNFKMLYETLKIPLLSDIYAV